MHAVNHDFYRRPGGRHPVTKPSASAKLPKSKYVFRENFSLLAIPSFVPSVDICNYFQAAVSRRRFRRRLEPRKQVRLLGRLEQLSRRRRRQGEAQEQEQEQEQQGAAEGGRSQGRRGRRGGDRGEGSGAHGRGQSIRVSEHGTLLLMNGNVRLPLCISLCNLRQIQVREVPIYHSYSFGRCF